MNAWGVLPFDNSRAADWVYALVETSDRSQLELALGRLKTSDADWFDYGAVCEALAACEVVARMSGHGSDANEFTDLVDHWIARLSIAGDSDLTARAREVVSQVLDRQLRLRDLSGIITADAWRAALVALDHRLTT